jgi:hypothetical protein
MTLNCSVSSSAPSTTNVVMGYVNNNNIYLDLSTSPTADVKVVNDFILVIGNHITTNIENYPLDGYFETNIVLPYGDCDLDIINIDYNSLSDNDKNIVDQFVNLINEMV